MKPQQKKPLTKKQIYMRQKRASARKFKRGLGIYAISLSIIFLALLIYVFFSLLKYQKSINQDMEDTEMAKSVERAPQEYFQSYIYSMTSDDWVNAWCMSHPENLDTKEDISAFLNTEVITPGFSLFKAPDYSSSCPKYLVRTAEKDIVTFTLTGSELNWSVSNVLFHINGQESGSITVPYGSMVSCNGIGLSDTYISEDTTSNTDFKYTDSLVNPVNYVTYTVQGLISPPTFTAESASDSTCIWADAKGNNYLALSPDTSGAYKQQAEAFIKALLYYYAQGKNNIDENLSAVLNLVPGGSDASSIIKQSYDGVVWRYPENINYTITTSEVLILADNCYCVDITYSNPAEIESNEESASSEEDADTIRVYLLDLGAGFKIYSFAYV